MKSKSIAFAIAAVTLSAGSLSFAQGYDHRGDDHQRYEQRNGQRFDYHGRWQDGDGQRRVEHHDQRYERSDRRDWRNGSGQTVYVQPTYVQPAYVQPSYYGGEQLGYIQQGYGQQSYYGESSSGDAALAFLVGGLISQVLVNH